MIRGKMFRSTIWVILPLAAVLIAAVYLLFDNVAETDADWTPVLIIDAGHGGEDGGAVAPDGKLESEINLDVALRLDALARFWGLETVMTRMSGHIEYPESAQTLSAKKKADQDARLALIHEISGGILLSIHQNNYPAASPYGIQVFYGAEPESDAFALILQGNLTTQLCPDNRRVAESIDDGIYLMRNAGCPSVLVECGFLSNPEELVKLESEDYRMELAAVMLASYLQYIRGISL